MAMGSRKKCERVRTPAMNPGDEGDDWNRDMAGWNDTTFT